MLAFLADFFLSEWLWSLTWGIYHIPINIIIMFLLIKITVHYGNWSSFFLTVAANIFGLVGFTVLVGSILIFVVGIHYLPAESAYSGEYNNFATSLCLGIIYAVLEIPFFYAISKRYQVHFSHMAIIALLSNVMTAQLVYLLLTR